MHNVSVQGLLEGVLSSEALNTQLGLPHPTHTRHFPTSLPVHARTSAHAHPRPISTHARTHATWMMGLRTDDGGTVVGSRLGASVGAAVGLRLGDPDGCSVGESDGCTELYSAVLDGASDGVSDGNPDGPKLGVPVGRALGACMRIACTTCRVGAQRFGSRAVGGRA